MIFRARILTVFSTLLVMQAAAGSAFAEIAARFTAPSSPSGVLRIDLPDSMDALTLTTLGVELDNIDITAMLSLDGKDFSYTPVRPLAPGAHVLRLVVINPDGTFTEQKKWAFTIAAEQRADRAEEPDGIAAAEAWLRSASMEVNTSTELSTRLAGQHLGSTPDHTIASGGGDMTTRLEGGNWAVSSRANYLLQSDTDLALTGNAMDLGEYDILAEYTGGAVKGAFQLGHQDPGLNNLLFSGFRRRGASLGLGASNGRMEAKTFALRPESVAGARNFTGLDDADHRLAGGSVSFKPFSAGEDALKVTGTYYDGKGATSGVGLVDNDGTATGKGWGAVFEKVFGGGRLSLRGEYAHSRYDADGSAALATEDASDGLSLSADVRPFDRLVLWERDVDLTVGVRYDRIDTFFQSLGNAGLPSDRDAIMAYTTVVAGSFSGNLQAGYETNNVDDLAALPTDRLRTLALNTAYTFDQQTGGRTWLGTPYISANALVSDTDRADTPLGYAGPGTDNHSNSLTLAAGSSYADWNWTASHTISEFEDDAGSANDTVNNLSGLAAGWTVSDRLSINGGVQVGAFRDEDAGQATYNTNILFGAAAVLIPDRLDLNFDYNLNLAAGSGDTPDRNVFNSEIEWTFLQPARNRPGLALALRGSMEDTHEDTTVLRNETNYQVFSVIRVKAPFLYDR